MSDSGLCGDQDIASDFVTLHCNRSQHISQYLLSWVVVGRFINTKNLATFQIRAVKDRHWMEVEGVGSVGLVPSSVLVKMDLPPLPSHKPVFVAYAEFLPSQPGDLGLAKGTAHKLIGIDT